MAVKSVQYENPSKVGNPVNDAVLATWTLAAGDVGQPVKIGDHADRTIHFVGAFAGSAMEMRGSNLESPDPSVDTDWFTVSDPKLTTPITNILSPSGYVIYENPLWLSPKCTGGAATALKTSILGRKRP